MKLSRRTLLGGLIGGLASATAIAATRAEGDVVSIPEGECELACWDANGTPVACDNPCPDGGEEPSQTPVPDGPVAVPEADEWLYEVSTLPSTGTGPLIIFPDYSAVESPRGRAVLRLFDEAGPDPSRRYPG